MRLIDKLAKFIIISDKSKDSQQDTRYKLQETNKAQCPNSNNQILIV